jgi:hypothetical protein
MAHHLARDQVDQQHNTEHDQHDRANGGLSPVPAPSARTASVVTSYPWHGNLLKGGLEVSSHQAHPPGKPGDRWAGAEIAAL